MCLLAEMAYEHNEDLREHVPLLLHVLLSIQDCPEPIVYHHAQQALLNLLYSLSTRHLESALGQEGFQVCACSSQPSLSVAYFMHGSLVCIQQEEPPDNIVRHVHHSLMQNTQQFGTFSFLAP